MGPVASQAPGTRGAAGLGLALAAALLAWPAPARAASCSFTLAGSIAFGTYDPFAGAPLDSVGTLIYRCSRGSPVVVSLGPGGGGTYARRALVAGGERLSYQLYLDAARTQVWGDGTGGTALGPGAVITGAQGTRVAWIYARIPPGQDVAPGAYSDAVQVTFDF